MLITKSASVNDAVKILSEKTNATFAITLGKAGTLLMHKKNLITVSSIPVKSVDSTGAGDAFVGAVLYQLRNYSLQEIQAMSDNEWKIIIANGNIAGARTCEYMGAMEAFHHLSSQIFD